MSTLADYATIRQLLEALRGGRFNVQITLSGGDLIGQKVVAVENGLVYTVDAAGNAHATVIAEIRSVHF